MWCTSIAIYMWCAICSDPTGPTGGSGEREPGGEHGTGGSSGPSVARGQAGDHGNHGADGNRGEHIVREILKTLVQEVLLDHQVHLYGPPGDIGARGHIFVS